MSLFQAALDQLLQNFCAIGIACLRANLPIRNVIDPCNNQPQFRVSEDQFESARRPKP
jgi:hypothetical protein